MKIPVLICDDSGLARKQMARALPSEWDVELSFAANGQEAIEAIRAGKSDVLFLDLNMPVMNGYEVLEMIRAEDLPTLVLVVSGDIQPDARQQVMSKGALDFVQKPVSTEAIREVLTNFGIIGSAAPAPHPAAVPTEDFPHPLTSFSDVLQEVINVSMGQAGNLVAELLGIFIRLPVPIVHQCRYSHLPQRLACRTSSLSAISHGFVGTGVAGEAMVLIEDRHLKALVESLAPAQSKINNPELGLLTDLSCLLTGGCLHGISTQLDLDLSHSAPVMLGRDATAESLLITNARDPDVIAVEINYELRENVLCHLLIVFTGDSYPVLQERTALLQ